ncbi:hypothetical protein FSP39_021746 [Pinctada imbricata]|uniref:Uncharacterized protein n=1 Tax=Pinctada imbricata TaxID=66713 RepID=A0AA89BL60_PINIB|nr:hypothetical protein FSP39_021746 [Pinctada imbricata]
MNLIFISLLASMFCSLEGAGKSKSKTPVHLKAGSADTIAILDKIKQGAIATTEILNAIGSINATGSFSKKITTISGKIAPFLGAVGPLIAFASALIQNETKEMTEIRNLFQSVEKRFNEVYNQFEDTRTIIQKTSLEEMYSPYENRIISVHAIYSRYINASGRYDGFLSRDLFLLEHNDGNAKIEEAVMAMYYGMTSSPYFGMNIPMTVLDYTNNHRRRMQNTAAMVNMLMLKGLQVIYAYNNMTDRGNENAHLEKFWISNIDKMNKKILDADNISLSRFDSQYKKDIDEIMTDNAYPDVPNTVLGDKLINLLKEKYDWLDWVVVTFRYQYMKTKDMCPGVYQKFVSPDRNALVVHFPKEERPVLNTLKGAIQNYISNAEQDRLSYLNMVYVAPQYSHLVSASMVKEEISSFYQRLPGMVRYGCDLPAALAFKIKADPHEVSAYRATNEQHVFYKDMELNDTSPSTQRRIYVIG